MRTGVSRLVTESRKLSLLAILPRADSSPDGLSKLNLIQLPISTSTIFLQRAARSSHDVNELYEGQQ